MGNLSSFFSRKPQQENEVSHSTVNKPIFLKYYLEQEELPEITGYISALDIIVELVQRNRLPGPEERLMLGAKALSLYLFEGLGDHFSDLNDIIYISLERSSQFIDLLDQKHCISSGIYLSREKAESAIEILLGKIPEEKKQIYSYPGFVAQPKNQFVF